MFKVIEGENSLGMNDFKLELAHCWSTRGLVNDTGLVNDGTSHLLKKPRDTKRQRKEYILGWATLWGWEGSEIVVFPYWSSCLLSCSF